MNKQTNIDQAVVQVKREYIGDRISAHRQMKKMDQEAMADAVGVKVATIQKIEAGKFNTPIDLYIKIALVLECNINII